MVCGSLPSFREVRLAVLTDSRIRPVSIGSNTKMEKSHKIVHFRIPNQSDVSFSNKAESPPTTKAKLVFNFLFMYRQIPHDENKLSQHI